MIEKKVTELADRMIQLEFNEREEQLQREIQLVQSEFAQRGLGTSSAVVEGVYDLCARDVELRTQIVWLNLYKVLSTAEVVLSEEIAEDSKKVVLEYWSLTYTFPMQCLQRVTTAVGIGSTHALTEAQDKAVKKINTQIDLLLLRADTDKKTGSSSQPIFNINAPVGAIQTGPNATATIAQTLTPQDREGLREALDRVKQDLAGVDHLHGYEKDEVIELIEEGRAEIDKPKPNSMRVSSVFSMIAAAIGTVGSLGPAYRVLKAALLPFGIQLP